MSTLTLTREELHDLSGYHRAAEQIAWLRKQGITHFIAADGRPRVIRDSLIHFARPTIQTGPKLRLA